MRPHCREKRSLKSVFFTTVFVLSAPFCVVAQTSADLIISSCSKSATTVAPGARINLSNTAKNQGTAAAGSFVIAFHLSTDSVFGGSNDISFSTTRTVSSLVAGATNSNSTSLTIPSTVVPGVYFICAQADSSSSVAESNETNNSLCTASTLQIAAADLLMTQVSSTTSSVGAGGSLVVANTVKNQSMALTGSFKIAFRLSMNSIYGDGDDIAISSSRSPSSLAAGASSSADTTLAIPGSTPTGNYHVCSKADSNSVVLESNETNNTLCSISTVAVAGPVITGISPTSGSIGSSITISGSGFGATQGSSAVTFNGVSAVPTSWTATAIVVPVPSGATTGLITVKVSGVSSNGISFTVSAGSSNVSYAYDELGRLIAENDSAMGTAAFNYDAVGNLLSIARQSSTAVSILEFSPNSGPVGSAVTITGTGYSATASQNIVKFNGVVATVDSATTTQIVARVPATASTGPINITCPGGSAVSSSSFIVAAGSGPTITSFSPNIASPIGLISINGANFDPSAVNNRVEINVKLGGISSATTSTIVASVPVGGTSGRISIATPAGQATSNADVFVPPYPFSPADVEFTTRLTTGQPVNVSLSTGGKIALLVFDAIPGQSINLAIQSASVISLMLYDPYGNILIAPTYNVASIGPQVLSASGSYTLMIVSGIISTVAGGGFGDDGGQATDAYLFTPEDVAVDSQGNFFISDTGTHRIRKVSTSGIITTVAGTGVQGYSGEGGLATNANLSWPSGLVVDQQGSIYFVDNGNGRIRKVSATGIITKIAGTGTQGFSGDGGAATNAKINGVSGIALDAQGNLFISDSNNLRVRKINNSGIISTVAGTGLGGFSGDGGPAVNAQLAYPRGIAIDPQGNLYIADSSAQRIRKVDTVGIITTIAGTGEYGFAGDGGPALSASFANPSEIEVDNFGKVFISDTLNHRIRKVNAAGIITKVAGTSFGFSGNGGFASLAQLFHPSGLALDGKGNLLMCDSSNNRIRKIWEHREGTSL